MGSIYCIATWSDYRDFITGGPIEGGLIFE